jgi:hypothetical protein
MLLLLPEPGDPEPYELDPAMPVPYVPGPELGLVPIVEPLLSYWFDVAGWSEPEVVPLAGVIVRSFSWLHAKHDRTSPSPSPKKRS